MRLPLIPRLAAFCALVWVCGCGRGQDNAPPQPAAKADPAARLVGVWEGEMDLKVDGQAPAGQGPLPVRFEFRGDGTLKLEGLPVEGKTWKLAEAKGNTLT